MNIRSTLTAISLTLLAAGCSSMKITSDHNSQYDFGTIKTFQWIAGPAKILDEEDTYINEDIQKALNTELVKTGRKQVLEAEKADVQVAYYLKLKEDLEYSAPANRDDREFSGGFVYKKGSKNWTYEAREPDLNVYAVEIGNLTVLMYDAKTGERIWRGNLQTKIDRSKPQNEQNDLIRRAAEKLVSRSPLNTK